jgi:hypothetical protein
MNTKKYNKKIIDTDGELDLLKIFNFLYKKKISILIFSIFVTIISFVYYSNFQKFSYIADVKINEPSNRFRETMNEIYIGQIFNLQKFNSDINIKMISPVQLKSFLEKSKRKYGKSDIYEHLFIRNIEDLPKENDDRVNFFVPSHYSINSNFDPAISYMSDVLKDYTLHVRDEVISTYIEDIKISNNRLLKYYENEFEIAKKLGIEKPYFRLMFDVETKNAENLSKLNPSLDDGSFYIGTIVLSLKIENLKKNLEKLDTLSLSDLEYEFFITDPSSTIKVVKSISFLIIPISFLLSLIISSFVIYLKNPQK